MKSKKMFLSLVAIIFSIFIGYNILKFRKYSNNVIKKG